MRKIIKPSRLTILITAVVLLATVYFINMYRVQIVEASDYAEQSKNCTVSRQTVPAARGDILDRYGRVLVSNRVCNNLVFNTDELFEQLDPNAIILELAKAVEDSGKTYTDTLPITKEAPFEYTNISDIQRTRLDGYLDKYDLPASTSAVELMAVFRENFHIDPNYTSEEMRIIAGIRYEIKIRSIVATSDYIFAEDVSIDLITKLMERDIPGFNVQSAYIRDYNTEYASHILGYVGFMEDYNEYKNEGYSFNAKVGRAGAEKAFESYLHGTDGEAIITKTLGGTVISKNYITEPEPGNNVYLTNDLGLQETAENSLSSYITQTNKEREIENKRLEALGDKKEQKAPITGGAVVAIDVKTGEPLCIASAPNYDLSHISENYDELLEAENSPLFNRALLGAYEPGSTFKPVTALAALSEGAVTTNTTFNCTGKYTKYEKEGFAPKCWVYPYGHGNTNITKAIEVSCNVYFYNVGDLIGSKKIAEYAKKFGLGESTGIELAEKIGVRATPEYKKEKLNEDWYVADTLMSAIGQSFNMFTPLQLANYTAALANNGTRYEASILKSVHSYDGTKSVFERKPVVAGKVNSSQEFFDAIHTGMYNGANSVSGTGYKVFGNYPVPVSTKTGTAQKGEGQTNNAVFVCYAPSDDPEIAVAVVVEKGNAGISVGPIARDVLDYYFNFKNSTSAIESENTLLK